MDYPRFFKCTKEDSKDKKNIIFLKMLIRNSIHILKYYHDKKYKIWYKRRNEFPLKKLLKNVLSFFFFMHERNTNIFKK